MGTTETKQLSAGDRVPTSGVYRVRHRRHRLPHDVTMLEGEVFPQCKKCGQQVRFEPVQTAGRILGDLDFKIASIVSTMVVLQQGLRFRG